MLIIYALSGRAFDCYATTKSIKTLQKQKLASESLIIIFFLD